MQGDSQEKQHTWARFFSFEFETEINVARNKGKTLS